jgi:hypothetical protein
VQLRDKEVLRIQDFKAASQEDVAVVHSMGYVKGLERVSLVCFDRVMISLLQARHLVENVVGVQCMR